MLLFFFNDTAPTEIYTLSLHDALPIYACSRSAAVISRVGPKSLRMDSEALGADRKSTRLNSSHMSISYAVFCLKKKNNGVVLPLPVGPVTSTMPHGLSMAASDHLSESG